MYDVKKIMSFEIFVCSHTWAKLAKTRRGKVAKMRSETLHSTMNATMNEVRRDVMFCNITEILSAMADFTSAASVAKRAATRLELCSSSSNHPTSFLRIAEQRHQLYIAYILQKILRKLYKLSTCMRCTRKIK